MNIESVTVRLKKNTRLADYESATSDIEVEASLEESDDLGNVMETLRDNIRTQVQQELALQTQMKHKGDNK